MSVQVTYQVRCDGGDGEHTFDQHQVSSCHGWVNQPANSVGSARYLARDQGWTFRNGRDLCPGVKK